MADKNKQQICKTKISAAALFVIIAIVNSKQHLSELNSYLPTYVNSKISLLFMHTITYI